MLPALPKRPGFRWPHAVGGTAHPPGCCDAAAQPLPDLSDLLPLAPPQRILLYDLEEDEEEEGDEDEEEGGQELADAPEGQDMDSDTFESPLSR